MRDFHASLIGITLSVQQRDESNLHLANFLATRRVIQNELNGSSPTLREHAYQTARKRWHRTMAIENQQSR